MRKRTNRPVSVKRQEKQCRNWRSYRRIRNLSMDTDRWRPTKRSQCPVERPCPYVTCRYHMYLDYTDKGEIYLYHDGNKRLYNIECTCFFDLIKNNNTYTYEEIGKIFGFTKERARQITQKALEKLRKIQMEKKNEMQ